MATKKTTAKKQSAAKKKPAGKPVPVATFSPQTLTLLVWFFALISFVFFCMAVARYA